MSRGEKISKSHASGVVILIFIVLFIQGVLFLFGSKEKLQEDVVKPPVEKPVNTRSVKSSEIKTNIHKQKNIEKQESLKMFDPNTIDKSGLIDLGLSPKQAQVVINYRLKGGKFRNAADFAKIYVISSKTFDSIKDYISIVQKRQSPVYQDTIAKTTVNVTTSTKPESDFTKNTEEVTSKKKLLLPLNRADSVQLLALPGIGPYYARKIIQYREKLGGFASKEQLLEIYGIDQQRLDLFEDRIEIDTNDVTKIDLKEATFEDLSRNPYIGGYVARAIIRYREKCGVEVTDLARLITNKIIREELFKILKYYFK